MSTRLVILAALLLAIAPAAVAQQYVPPDTPVPPDFSDLPELPKQPSRRAKQLARYRAFNDARLREIEMQARHQQFFAQQALESAREARAARPSAPANPRPPLQGPPAPPRHATILRRDVSGPYGYDGAPGPIPYSRNIRTGERIPSDMIPPGLGRLYSTIDRR